jgi:uncharacterized protein
MSIHSLTLKVSARCNLNCSYCYVFNMEDSTWKSKPAVMNDETFISSIVRLKSELARSSSSQVSIVFHGGEPLLIGERRLDDWCSVAQDMLSPVKVLFVIQTNATLISSGIARVLKKHRFSVGISIDGDSSSHDSSRVDHRGIGSYDRVCQGIAILQEHSVPYAALCVLSLEKAPQDLHAHLVSLGPQLISYLLPDFSHDNFPEDHGNGQYGEYLVELFDSWFMSGRMSLKVQPFYAIAELILGGQSTVDIFGNQPLGFVFVETDGSIESLDVLRVCQNGLTSTSFNVNSNEFSDYASSATVAADAVFRGTDIPTGCLGCSEMDTCGGGYLPHRFKAGDPSGEFNHPSVWCRDLKHLFEHVRRSLGVTEHETRLRRALLSDLS